MITSRLLGTRFPYTQLTRNLNFFRTRKDPPTEEELIPDTSSVVQPLTEQRVIEIPKRKLPYLNPHIPARQVWVENLDTIEKNMLGIIDLHPKIFGTDPRVDLIHDNIVWQRKYKYVNWDFAPCRLEVLKSNRKPWPQKGTGRARHGTRKSPLFKGGAICHGPRGPKSHFYMLNIAKRILGLCATLTIKLAQDDIHFIDRLEIPSEQPKFLLDLAEQRKWGASVLFVDKTDVLTRNMALALDGIPQFMAMPAYGLNCYSMLKFETLVLTLDAVDHIEEKLLWHMNNPHVTPSKFNDKVLRA